MKKSYQLEISQDTVRVFSEQYRKEMGKASRKLAISILITLGIIGGTLWYMVSNNMDWSVTIVIMGFVGGIINIGVWMGVVSVQNKQDQIDRLYMYQKMFKNEQLTKTQVHKLIDIQPVPSVVFTEKDTAEDRRRKEREAAKVEEENRQKEKAFREYDADGIASIHDLARVTSRGLNFIKEDFNFFVGKGFLLNLKIDEANGCFIVSGERMQKWGRAAQPIATAATTTRVNTAAPLTNCPNCGALRKNLSQQICEYCDAVIG